MPNQFDPNLRREESRTLSPYHLPELPYAPDELQPLFSAEQLECHLLGHHQVYVDQVNRQINELGRGVQALEFLIRNEDGKLFNSAAQAWNHTFFWMGLTPMAGRSSPEGPLLKAVRRQFGDVATLRERFLESAASVFGSGYCWLVATPEGDIEVMNTANADNPMRFERVRPIWTCDVWEHAYYVDYRQDRRNYQERAWNQINWEFVRVGYESEKFPDMTSLMTKVRPPTRYYAPD